MRIDPMGTTGPASVDQANTAANAPGSIYQKRTTVTKSAEAEVFATHFHSPVPDHDVSVQVDDERHRIYRIVDKVSGELIQQVPPEELLRVMRNIGQLLENTRQNLKVTG